MEAPCRAAPDRGPRSRGAPVPPGRRRSDRRRAVEPQRSAQGRARYALLLGALFALLFARSRGDAWIGDFWIYVATVGELAAHPFRPGNPLFAEPWAFAFLSPWAVALGLAARVTGAPAVDVLVAQGLVNLVLLGAALYAFVATWTTRPAAAYYALLFTLFLWGHDPWLFSGFFHLRSLSYVLPYPSTFAAATALGTLAAFPRLADAPRKWLPLVVPVSALLFAVHPVTAMFFWVGLAAASLGAPRSLGHWGALGAAGAGSFALAMAWPLVPMRALWFGQIARVHEGNDSMYDDPIARIAPALLGVPWLLWRLRRDRRDPLALCALGLALLVVYGGLSGQWSYGRLVAPAVLMLHVALADALAAAEERLGRLRRGLALRRLVAPAVGLLLVASTWPVVSAIVDESRRPGDRRWLRFLEDRVQPDDVVLTDLDTCWYVPAFRAKGVAYPMQLPFVPDHAERVAAVTRFFEPDASGPERREILARYRVAYVLVPKHHFPERPELRAELAALGVTVYSDVEYDLLRVANASP